MLSLAKGFAHVQRPSVGYMIMSSRLLFGNQLFPPCGPWWKEVKNVHSDVFIVNAQSLV